jgi:hypothetical protein
MSLAALRPFHIPQRRAKVSKPPQPRRSAQPLGGESSMPIKSKAQRRKFAELLVKGKISPETYEEWNREAGNAELPERLHAKAKAKSKRKVKSKRVPNSRTTRSKKGSRPAR